MASLLPRASGTPKNLLVTEVPQAPRSLTLLLSEAPALTTVSQGISGCFLQLYLCFPSLFLPGLVCVRKPLSLFPVSLSFPPLPFYTVSLRTIVFLSNHSWSLGMASRCVTMWGGRQVCQSHFRTALKHQRITVNWWEWCLLAS